MTAADHDVMGVSEASGAARDVGELRRRVLEHEGLRSTLAGLTGRPVLFAPNPGNVGDGFIALGAYHLFDALGFAPDIMSSAEEERLTPEHVLVLGGGGGLVEGLYDEPFGVISRHLARGGELVLLPSTVVGFLDFLEAHAGQVTLFARERTTFEALSGVRALAGRMHLCDDLAFAIDPDFLEPFRASPGAGVLEAFRSDDESLSAQRAQRASDIQLFVNGHVWHDRGFCARIAALYAEHLTGFSMVDTDRLHLSILGALLGRETVMRPNSYHKNRSVYDHSLSGLPKVLFRDEAPSPRRASALTEAALSKLELEVLRRKSEFLEGEVHRFRPGFVSLERDRLTRELKLQTGTLESLQAELTESGAENEALTDEIGRLRDELDQSLTRVDQVETRDLPRLREALADAEAELGELRRERAEVLLPQAARLQQEAEELRREKAEVWLPRTARLEEELRSRAEELATRMEDLQAVGEALSQALAREEEHRRRAMQLEVEQAREREARLALTGRVAELEDLSENTLRPEVETLREQTRVQAEALDTLWPSRLAEAETSLTRSEVEASSLREQKSELEAELLAARSALASIQTSRSFRALGLYRRLYDLPMLGPGVRRARRAAARVRLALRSRGPAA